MKKVIITGGNGQLGSDIVAELLSQGFLVIPKTHEQLDITDYSKVGHVLEQEQPDILINTAAYHNVDMCELNPEQAMQVNYKAPAFMARLCRSLGTRFIHFSTDYVFDGTKDSAYIESDIASPINVYGLSKKKGETAVLNENPEALILRISAIYGAHPCRAKNGLNFILLMLKLAKERGFVRVVDDETVSPTSTESIAKMIPLLLEHKLGGVVHLSSEGSCSWYEFAQTMFDILGRSDVDVQRAKSADFPSKTPRPAYSVLENNVLKQHALPLMPHWKESLRKFLKTLDTSEYSPATQCQIPVGINSCSI